MSNMSKPCFCSSAHPTTSSLLPPSSPYSSSQFWSDPHGLQHHYRKRQQAGILPSTTSLRTSNSGSVGSIGEGRTRTAEGDGVHVRVPRALEGGDGESSSFSSTVLSTTSQDVSEATAAAAAASRPARGPSWRQQQQRRSLSPPPVSPWPIRHWWAQGWTIQ